MMKRLALVSILASLSIGGMTSSAHASCSASGNIPAGDEGDLAYVSADKMLYFCDGSSWVSAGGGMSPWTTSGSDISFSGGNVGIGISPTQKLHVNGNIVNEGHLITRNGNRQVLLLTDESNASLLIRDKDGGTPYIDFSNDSVTSDFRFILNSNDLLVAHDGDFAIERGYSLWTDEICDAMGNNCRTVSALATGSSPGASPSAPSPVINRKKSSKESQVYGPYAESVARFISVRLQDDSDPKHTCRGLGYVNGIYVAADSAQGNGTRAIDASFQMLVPAGGNWSVTVVGSCERVSVYRQKL